MPCFDGRMGRHDPSRLEAVLLGHHRPLHELAQLEHFALLSLLRTSSLSRGTVHLTSNGHNQQNEGFFLCENTAANQKSLQSSINSSAMASSSDQTLLQPSNKRGKAPTLHAATPDH
ncbi:hypothetical protein FQN60_016981 [Etheostoma spectabile]|uniref:Uncharacterized protein n=1 Tax=Etheostoma spectabile TaxID=54343 RepID=A0A5J5DE79_9PERO|nr:hypothetical protein FQN60_016981 [Etheostoma spectabile]